MNLIELNNLVDKYNTECVGNEYINKEHLKNFLIENIFTELKKKSEKKIDKNKEEIPYDKNTKHCSDCYWFNGSKGDGFQFCDKREIDVHENDCCSYHKSSSWF